MDVTVELLQEGVYQGCFACTHLTCEDGEASVIFDPADKLGQSLLVFRTQVEAAWIRGNIKGIPSQAKMALIRRIHDLAMRRAHGAKR